MDVPCVDRVIAFIFIIQVIGKEKGEEKNGKE
jgi:hypothetical protein